MPLDYNHGGGIPGIELIYFHITHHTNEFCKKCYWTQKVVGDVELAQDIKMSSLQVNRRLLYSNVGIDANHIETADAIAEGSRSTISKRLLITREMNIKTITSVELFHPWRYQFYLLNDISFTLCLFFVLGKYFDLRFSSKFYQPQACSTKKK